MYKIKLKELYTTLGILVFIIILTISGLIYSLSILKNESINTHIKLAKVHTSIYTEQITNTFNNTELIIDNISTILNNNEDDDNFNILNNKFENILSKSPFIRSINILNNNKEVIFSSNIKNLKIRIKSNDFLPKPIFSQNILRFGIPHIGRYLNEEELLSSKDYNNTKSSYLPIIKKIYIKEKEFFILITINSDYFLNIFTNHLEKDYQFIDLSRVDGLLLFSSQKDYNANNKTHLKLLDKILEKNRYSIINTINHKEYISSYKISEIYPLIISIRFDLKKSLKSWEEKRTTIIFIITFLIIFSIILLLTIIFKKNIEKENEILFHKRELESKNKFHSLFQQTTHLVSILDTNGSIIDINQVVLKFLNKDIEQIRGMKFWELDCWQVNEKIWIKNKIKDFNPKNKVQREIKAINSNKDEKIINFSLEAITLSNSYEIVALGFDITEKKMKELELQYAYIVFQNTHDGIVITDEHTNIISINKAFTNSTGYELYEIKNKKPNLLNSQTHSKNFYKQMWKDLITTGFWEGELVNKKKDGSLYNEKLSISAVYDENKFLKNYIGIFSDITKQKKQERVLKEQESLLNQQSKLAAMGEMIENIAHQWRQPLSIISTTATSMQLQIELGITNKEDELQKLDSINESTQYLSKTIDDFRNFLKIDKIKSNFELSDTLDKSLNLISSKLKNKDIKIIKNTTVLRVDGIQNELLQVFINILSNAKDAFQDKNIINKAIFIDIYKENTNAIILIKDNAGGMEELILHRIFEPYFTTKHKSQGTGIGLYMSQEIITNHLNGTLTCFNTEFEYKGKQYRGANFKISIPLV